MHFSGSGIYGRNNIGRSASGITDSSDMHPSHVNSEIPLLTYGQEVYLGFNNFSRSFVFLIFACI